MTCAPIPIVADALGLVGNAIGNHTCGSTLFEAYHPRLGRGTWCVGCEAFMPAEKPARSVPADPATPPTFKPLDAGRYARARSLVRLIYQRHPTGCCLHVVLDDHNKEDDIVAWCAGIAYGRREYSADHDACADLGTLLEAMTVEQREALTADEEEDHMRRDRSGRACAPIAAHDRVVRCECGGYRPDDKPCGSKGES